jgi:hypothetical protein
MVMPTVTRKLSGVFYGVFIAPPSGVRVRRALAGKLTHYRYMGGFVGATSAIDREDQAECSNSGEASLVRTCRILSLIKR